MTKPRATLLLFRKPKPADTRHAPGRQIPIRTVSRAAIEELVASFNRSATHAD